MEVPKWNLTDLFHNVSENYFQIYDYRIRLFFARILCWPKTLLTSWKWRHSFVKGKNIMTEEMIMSAANVAFFYFPAGKQFVIKGSFLATGIQEYFVPAILKIGLLKGQLISKCPYEILVSSKIPTKLFLDFCPEIFCSFLGASWKFFGLPVGFLIYAITY